MSDGSPQFDIARDLAEAGITNLTSISPSNEIAAAVVAVAKRIAAVDGMHAELLIAEAIGELTAIGQHRAERVVDQAVKSERARAKARSRALRRSTGHTSEELNESLPAGVVIDSDLANAHRLAAAHGDDVRFAPELGWLAYDGQRWISKADAEVNRCVHSVARDLELRAAELLADAARAPSDEAAGRLRSDSQLYAAWAKKSQSASKIRDCMTVAKTLDGIACHASNLDPDPWLLNCTNGTLNLRTGELRSHRREDLITRLAPFDYDADAQAPLWERFQERVLPDPEARAFRRRWAGYCLTGSTREQCFVVAIGPGANGKSTDAETFRVVMGDYAADTPSDTIMQSRHGRGTENDVARLRGARFVTAKETGEGKRLDEPRVKQLTGGDTVTARFLYSEHFEFVPSFKLWLYCNHQPEIRGTDDGIWRRVLVLPYEVTIPEAERDPELMSKLRAEAPGILAWAVRGCLEWQREGLRPPEAVRLRTQQWRADADELAQFIADRCEVLQGAKAKTSALYAAYEAWVREQGIREPMTSTMLGRRLGEMGYSEARTKSDRYRQGIGLAAPEDE